VAPSTRRRSALKAARRRLAALVPNPTPEQALLLEKAARMQAFVDVIDTMFVRGGRMTPDGARLRLGFESVLASHLAALGIAPRTRAPP
jgi:hypothetical protein